MSNSIGLNQEFIKVNVEFYDNNEENNLLKYPTSDKIIDIVSNPVEIPLSEFLTYYLFYRKRPKVKGWSNYSEISNRVNRAWSDIEDFIHFNGRSINVPLNIENQVPHITEYVGESIGLSIINRIHNLTEADWNKIPEQRGRHGIPTFDYSYIASDGEHIIQVETKGSSVVDNRSKCVNIYQHKYKIKLKKRKIKFSQLYNPFPLVKNLQYGTISALDARNEGEIKCYLLDPPSDDIKLMPLRIKLINRIGFFRDWISFISPRSQFATALSTRLESIINIDDPYELNKIPLIRGNNIPFDYDFYYGARKGWFRNKSYVVDGPHSGLILNLSPKRFFFLGFRNEIIELVANQNFNKILEYRTKTAKIFKKVHCIISEKKFQEFKLTKDFQNKISTKKNYCHFTLSGNLYFSPEGLVFGILPVQ